VVLILNPYSNYNNPNSAQIRKTMSVVMKQKMYLGGGALENYSYTL